MVRVYAKVGFHLSTKHLSAKERILLHLFDHASSIEDYELPSEVTQKGIAEAIGIHQRHVSQYVLPLVSEELVAERKAHVREKRQRYKVYSLTLQGRSAVRPLRNLLMDKTVPYRRRNGEVSDLVFSKVYYEERRGSSVLELLEELGRTGTITEVVEGARPAEPLFLAGEAPLVEQFYGRDSELTEIVTALDTGQMVIVTGMAGIGKTALGARLCQELRGDRSIFWRRIRPWDSPTDLAFRLAEFLKSLDKPRLYLYLSGSRQTGLGRTEEILSEDLPGLRALLLFDDLHANRKDAEDFLMVLHEVLKGQEDCSALVLSRKVPSFYNRRDVEVEGTVAEVPLGSLDEASACQFLADKGIPRTLWKEILELSTRSPLFLKILMKGDVGKNVRDPRRTLETYITEEIEPVLSGSEKKCLQVASFYEVPTKPKGLLLGGEGGTETVVGLQRKGLLDPLERGTFLAHDSIRRYFRAGLPPQREAMLIDKIVPWLSEEAQRLVDEGEYDDTVRFLENAVMIDTQPARKLINQEQLAYFRDQAGDITGSVQAYNEVLKASEDDYVLARIHRRIAWTYNSSGNLGEMSRELAEAERICPPGPSVEAANLRLEIGRIAVFYYKDLEAAQKEVNLVRTWLPNLSVGPEVRGMMAIIQGAIHSLDRERRDPARAFNFFKTAYEEYKTIPGERDTTDWCLRLQAIALFDQGKSKECHKYLDKSVAWAKERGSPMHILSTLHEKGVYLAADGQLAAADQILERTFRLAKSFDPGVGLVAHYHVFACLRFWQGRNEEARESMAYFIKAAQDVFPLVMTSEASALLLAFMVRLCVLSGDPETAYVYLREAEELARQKASRMAETGVEWAKALLFASEGREDEADASYRHAIRVSDGVLPARGFLALRLSPHRHRRSLLLDYGRFLASSGRTQAAIEILIEARDDPLEWALRPLESAVEEALESLGHKVSSETTDA